LVNTLQDKRSNPTRPRLSNDIPQYLLLALITCLAYLPLSSFLFAPKNDALVQNFPNKFFFSAALHSGNIPIWNPYINFGLPLYADPGFAFWHPLTWIFGLVGYSIHTLAIETLTYIWLGGVFMHRLGSYLGHDRLTCLVMAILFMCSGFFVGNLSHTNFLTAGAFLPLVTLTFLRLQTELSAKTLWQSAAALYLLLSAGHPAIPFATFYFLLSLLIGIVLLHPAPRKTQLLKSLKTNTILLMIVLVSSAPIFLSWIEISQNFIRSAPVLQKEQLDLGFSPASYISLVFPFSTTAHSTFFDTDVSMRNGYFSVLGLILFGIALARRRNTIQNLFLISGVLMLVLSIGGPIKDLVYSNTPLLRYIRTNGEYRVFAIFSFIIVLSYPLNELLARAPKFNPWRPILITAILCAMITTAATFYSRPFPAIPAADWKTTIKILLDTLSFAQRLFINAALLCLLLTITLLLRKKLPVRYLVLLLIGTDLLIFSWLDLGVTGVQKSSCSQIGSLFASVPPGIPVPRLQPISANKQTDTSLVRIIGCWPYYSKQPGTPNRCDYPTILNTTNDYFNSGLPDSLVQHPFLFLKNTPGNSSISIIKYTPASLEADISAAAQDTLILLQNIYSGWHAAIDRRPVNIQKQYLSFMGIALPPGHRHVSFYFSGKRPGVYLLLGLITMMILGIGACTTLPWMKHILPFINMVPHRKSAAATAFPAKPDLPRRSGDKGDRHQ